MARLNLGLTIGLLGLLLWLAPSRLHGQDLFGVAKEDARIAEEVRRIARLKGDTQRKALRSLLADGIGEAPARWDSIFYYEKQLRSSLRTLARDPQVGSDARLFLALIGVPEDLEFVVRLAPLAERERPIAQPSSLIQSFPPWTYGVACALTEPGEEGWEFLRRAALTEYGDRPADGAIQTLRLIAAPRSRQVLEGLSKLNESQVKSVASALDYIQTSPLPLMDRSLDDLSERVAKAIMIGKWSADGPRYNQTGDKALVDLTLQANLRGDPWNTDHVTYFATFHRVSGVWRLRGVRETGHIVVLHSPPRPRLPRIPILDPPPILPFEPGVSPLPAVPILQQEVPSRPLATP